MGTIARSLAAAQGYDVGELVICPCSWGVNGGTNPLATSIKGDILGSVTYAAGVYTATLTDVGYEIIAAIPGCNFAGNGVDMYAQVGAIDYAAKTVQVRMKTVGVSTEPPAADANSRVSLVIFLRRKSVSRGRR